MKEINNIDNIITINMVTVEYTIENNLSTHP